MARIAAEQSDQDGYDVGGLAAQGDHCSGRGQADVGALVLEQLRHFRQGRVAERGQFGEQVEGDEAPVRVLVPRPARTGHRRPAGRCGRRANSTPRRSGSSVFFMRRMAGRERRSAGVGLGHGRGRLVLAVLVAAGEDVEPVGQRLAEVAGLVPGRGGRGDGQDEHERAGEVTGLRKDCAHYAHTRGGGGQDLFGWAVRDASCRYNACGESLLISLSAPIWGWVDEFRAVASGPRIAESGGQVPRVPGQPAAAAALHRASSATWCATSSASTTTSTPTS